MKGYCAVFFPLVAFSKLCFGFGSPDADLLPSSISKSESIFIAKVIQLELEKGKAELKPSGYYSTKGGGKIPFFTGPSALKALTNFSPKGEYKVEVINQILGHSDKILTLDLPELSSLSYASSFQIKPGQNVLFFMREKDGKLVLTDPLRPFVPLSPQNTKSDSSQPTISQIVELLSQDLKMPESRTMMAYLLKDFHSAQSVLALAPYSDDENLQTRDYVLSGLAHNQQIGAIPRIRDLNRLLQRQNGMAQSVIDLESFSSMKTAVPYLNPLLFEGEQYIRLNAISALSRTADSSSIPYFLLALRDPEPQKVNAEDAFALLQRLTKNASSVPYKDFRAQKPKAIEEMVKWWQDELSGKHPLAEDETPRVTLRDGELYEAKDLPRLNEGLFMRSEFTRGAAIQALDKLADQSSIPYLLLAQYDPKPDIAFGAYKTLRRLLPELGAAKARGTFEAGREVLIQQGFDWWTKHLQENLPAEMRQKPPAALAGK